MRLDHPAVVLRFQRIGDEVLVLEGSLQPPLVGDSFAALATLPLVARTGDRLLVDATDFIIRDAYGVAESLMWVGEAGTLDPERSSVVWAAATGSDHTTDIDVRLTFDVPGGSQWVERRSSHPTTLTVVQRHVFFRPSRGFRPRPASDHMGLHAMPPLGVAGMPTGGTTTGWVQRWRLPRPSDADRVSPHPMPTIGIGAGRGVDGQVLVLHDLTGLQRDVSPRFVRRFADGYAMISSAVSAFQAEVEAGTFPADEETYE